MILEEGEMVCHKCKGKGHWYEESEFGDSLIICQWCQGKGKVDWIENIVGARSEFDFVDSGSFQISLSPDEPPKLAPGEMYVDSSGVLMQYDGQKWNVVEDNVT